ncbi:MAG TPA: hypothetical protein VF600_04995 [Abditibacteriaceae bacterium]|jgi:hypothetical protein
MIHQHQPPEPKDARVGLTTRIWFFATVMLAISSLPHYASGFGNVIVSLAILVGAGVGTAAVWGAFDGRETKQLPPAPRDLSELEERLSNLETISRYEHMLQSETTRSGQQEQPESRKRLAML